MGSQEVYVGGTWRAVVGARAPPPRSAPAPEPPLSRGAPPFVGVNNATPCQAASRRKPLINKGLQLHVESLHAWPHVVQMCTLPAAVDQPPASSRAPYPQLWVQADPLKSYLCIT